MSPADQAAVAAYRALESDIMADAPAKAGRVELVRAFMAADATAQAERAAGGRPRLNYLAAVAAGATA